MTGKIDTKAILAHVDLADLVATDLGQPVRHNGKYLFWKCPFHDDADPSFAVTPDRYYCFGCRASGDAIDWLVKYRKATFLDAIRFLGGDSATKAHQSTPISAEKINSDHPSKPAPDNLQAVWREVIQVCQDQLWSPVGKQALEYLHGRGLTDATLKSPFHRVGFSTGQKIAGVWVDRAVVIPCFTVKHDLTVDYVSYVKLRRGQSWLYHPEDKSKYRKLPADGADTSGLYNAELVRGADVVFMTEGEFDALILHQEAGDLVGVATVGSVTGGLDWSRWGKYLSFATRFFIAYDADPAGDKGADDWLKRTSRATRVRPPGGAKDINDALLAGADLKTWVMTEFEAAGVTDDNLL